MGAAKRADVVLERLLPAVLDGVRNEQRSLLAPYGASALELVERALDLLRLGVDLARDCVREDRMTTAEALSPFASFGHVVAESGHTAQSLRLGVTASYSSAIRLALSAADVADQAALMPLVAWGARLGPRIEQTEINAFLAWHSQSAGGRYRQEIARTLLSGAAVPAAEAAPAYLVALVAPVVPDADALARISHELADAKALTLPREDAVVLLRPLRSAAEPTARAQPPDLVELDLVGDGVLVALAQCRADGVPAACREAEMIMKTLRARNYPAGRYDRSSVLTDQLVAGDREAALALKDMITPIADSPVLLATLRHWLLGDADRKRVAAALHVHPNTLDRRLRVIEERTGLPVARHTGQHLLRLALAAVDLANVSR